MICSIKNYDTILSHKHSHTKTDPENLPTNLYISKIIRRYTDDVTNASMVINSYLCKGEFVVFDLTRPEDDLLAIRLRFDTPLNLQKEIEARQKRKEKSASANE